MAKENYENEEVTFPFVKLRERRLGEGDMHEKKCITTFNNIL